MKKQEVLEFLDGTGIDYEIIHHEAIFTMDEMTALKLPQANLIAKNLFIRDGKKRNYYLISVQEEKRIDLKRLSEIIASPPLSFASEKDLNEILGLPKGSVTPFGILNDQDRKVKVLIDIAFADGLIGVHPNDNTATVWLKTTALIKIIQAHGNQVELIGL